MAISRISLVLSGIYAKEHFHLLEREREAIEHEINEKLEWRELPNNKHSDVLLYWRGVTPTDPQHWGSYHAWMKEKLEAFYRAFAPRVKKLKASDYKLPIDSENPPDAAL